MESSTPDLPPIPHGEHSLHMSFLAAYCNQMATEPPQDPHQAAKMFEACRTGIGELFATEEGQLALSAVLAQKQGRRAPGSTPEYVSVRGERLAERIEALLVEGNPKLALDYVAKKQGVSQNVVVGNLQSILRRYAAIQSAAGHSSPGSPPQLY
ncbi:MAG TPA: hypothetical protein VJR27_04750 [Candidatus Saccharimonadales bacterium]|nr:hypothetical protein [Candidatus Saccharimonadales bacterium]